MEQESDHEQNWRGGEEWLDPVLKVSPKEVLESLGWVRKLKVYLTQRVGQLNFGGEATR